MGPRELDLRWGPDPERLREVASHLLAGGLVAMPTETVYGFGGVPEKAPLMELQRLKDRGPEKPFLLLVPSAESVPELRWGPDARELAGVFWPGALTLILEDPEGRFPEGVRSEGGGVAIRVSPHPVAKAVVEAVNGPLVSTSANTPGGPPALTAPEALKTARILGAGDLLWVLDGGPLAPSSPSTIVDCTGPRPVVRREGSLKVDRLKCVLPGIHEQL
ncbi:MAG: L-threonylcarbamoyladenylate synthase [Gemmatimonadetes bacterium]|nr:L-threonylcarbamoyladenylate synthase [Gemmatimonadota bacterium]NNM05660.1 L-threonylcarbamoyladenylate synthase [Gemmatimonadota bacterium]